MSRFMKEFLGSSYVLENRYEKWRATYVTGVVVEDEGPSSSSRVQGSCSIQGHPCHHEDPACALCWTTAGRQIWPELKTTGTKARSSVFDAFMRQMSPSTTTSSSYKTAHHFRIRKRRGIDMPLQTTWTS